MRQLIQRRVTAPRTSTLLDHLAAWQPLLDAMQTNVFVADASLTIVFANTTALRTLSSIEAELRRSFGIGASEIVGGSIHRFHRDPQRVETILHREQGFTLPHDARFTFGEVTLDTKINGLRDHAGESLGYIVSWEDVSELRRSNDTFRRIGEQMSGCSAAVEELQASIGEIEGASATAVGLAQQGVVDVQGTRTVVEDLGEASRRISDIVAMITAISEQTNLLALNATIEAARVGELGKGFAVVAGEVKELARSTGQATGGVTEHIERIQSQVTQVVASIGQLTEQMGQIEDQQTSIAGSVEQQGGVVAELARQISDAVSLSEDALARLEL